MPRLRPLPIASLSLALALAAFTVICQVIRLRAGGTVDLASPTAPLGVVMTGCGAVILSRRPGHAIGGILVGFGLLWAVDGALEAWYGLGITPPFGTLPDDLLPGTGFAYWFVARAGAFLLVGLPLVLVLYPTGRLLAGGWRWLGAATIVASAALPVTLLVMPAAVLELGVPAAPIPDPDLPAEAIPSAQPAVTPGRPRGGRRSRTHVDLRAHRPGSGGRRSRPRLALISCALSFSHSSRCQPLHRSRRSTPRAESSNGVNHEIGDLSLEGATDNG